VNRRDLAVGCLLLVALVVAAGLAVFAGAFRQSWWVVEVRVPAVDAAGLQEGADVAVVGIRVGQVTRLELEHDRAWLHLALDEDAQLRKDVTAQVRARSLLGEKYLELVPHDPAAPLLEDGDVLAPIGPQTEIDELVNALAPIVEAVDPALVAELAEAAARALREDPDRVGRMLADLEVLLHEGAAASRELPALAAEGRSTLALARRTLGDADARLVEAEQTIVRADRLLARLETTAAPLPETVDEARAAIADVRALVQKLGGPTDDLDRLLSNFSELDLEEVQRLLRDEGVRIRFSGRKGRDRATATP
jgi:phospholipid/cholesterol/gamma-HCH transport system substrate-binding protein